MKKLSLIIACIGIISVAAFGSGFPKTNPQDDSKKQKTQEVSRPGSKPVEIAKPVQVVSAAPTSVQKVEARVTTPAKVEAKREHADIKTKPVKRMTATETMEAVPTNNKK